MQRCPFCRARMRGEELCGRCGADLSLARRAELSARAYTARALEALLEGEPQTAARLLDHAIALRRDEHHEHISALIRWIGDAPGPIAESPVSDSEESSPNSPHAGFFSSIPARREWD